MTLAEYAGEANVIPVIAIIATTAVAMFAIVTWGFVSVIRGYPPNDQNQECNHENNLTGSCLRKPNCRTDDECHDLVTTIHRKNA
jgi:hypothetical protein